MHWFRVGFESHPSASVFAGIILAMLPDADVLSFKFALLTAMFLVIAVLPIRWCLRCCPAVMCADWTPMVQGWADCCWLFLTVSLLSHSLLDSVTLAVRALAGCGRGQMNAFSLPAGD